MLLVSYVSFRVYNFLRYFRDLIHNLVLQPHQCYMLYCWFNYSSIFVTWESLAGVFSLLLMRSEFLFKAFVVLNREILIGMSISTKICSKLLALFIFHGWVKRKRSRYLDNCIRGKLHPIRVRFWVRVSFRVEGNFPPGQLP